MKKKFIVLVMVLILYAGSSSVIATSLQRNSMLSEARDAQPQICYSTLKIGDVSTILLDNLDKISSNEKLNHLLSIFIEKGMQEMEEVGLSSDLTLDETESMMTPGKFFTLRLRGTHRFMFNVQPDAVILSTVLPRYVMNLTEDNSTVNKSLEIFVKLIPFFDSVETQQRLIIRKLYQKTTILWPIIGMRIVEGEETTFIVAFGFNINWSFRLF